MASRAFHLYAQERGRKNVRFRSHRYIILGSHRKACRTTTQLVAFHPDQFRDKAVHRLILNQRIVYPPAERSCVVQGWL